MQDIIIDSAETDELEENFNEALALLSKVETPLYTKLQRDSIYDSQNTSKYIEEPVIECDPDADGTELRKIYEQESSTQHISQYRKNMENQQKKIASLTEAIEKQEKDNAEFVSLYKDTMKQLEKAIKKYAQFFNMSIDALNYNASDKKLFEAKVTIGTNSGQKVLYFLIDRQERKVIDFRNNSECYSSDDRLEPVNVKSIFKRVFTESKLNI